jgi:hypothetical protein
LEADRCNPPYDIDDDPVSALFDADATNVSALFLDADATNVSALFDADDRFSL